MSPSPTLDQLQQWMLAVVTHPGGIVAGMQGESARQQIDVAADRIEEVIDRSRACTAIERLSVYGSAYFARLLECLQAEYRVLATAAGDDAFLALAAGYLQSHPSTSYTLGQLGAKLPQYLAETRPPRADDAPDWADFLIDLARLERTYAEVFDGPGEEEEPPLDPDRLQRSTPDDWGDARIQLSQSLRLLELRFPVHEAYTALRAGEDCPTPTPRPVQLAVNRRQYTVQRRELTSAQWTLLQALLTQQSLDEALAATLTAYGLTDDELLGLLPGWFQDWTAAGWVRGVFFSAQ